MMTTWLGLLALAAAATGGQAAPPAVEVWRADAIQWTEQRLGGAERAVLEGDIASPGRIVTYAFHLPAGAWFPAHSHQTTARVFVLKGALLLGLGASNDRSRVREVRVGEAAVVPAGLVHYEGAAVDTVILGVAEGPWTTRMETPVRSGGPPYAGPGTDAPTPR